MFYDYVYMCFKLLSGFFGFFWWR